MIAVDLDFDSQIQTTNEMGKWFLFLGEKMESGFDFEQNGIWERFCAKKLNGLTITSK